MFLWSGCCWLGGGALVTLREVSLENHSQKKGLVLVPKAEDLRAVQGEWKAILGVGLERGLG